ncbi:hypothetical protein [Nesterenkonia alba]|uniref:hypothetical protein n=1 Tax=Nesterenkonia alba TaxID=515814 RepID=UPI0003B3E3A5|nr:hypothetical protein [Nesterenkonia alba]
MAVSLHGLRGKIAAAAVVKGVACRLARVPGAARVLEAVAERVEPEDVTTGEADPTSTYRGILAGLLKDALGEDETEPGEAIVYDPVAGLVPATEPESAPQVDSLKARAEEDPTSGNLIAVAAAARKPYIGDLDTAAEYYERAFETNPKDLRAIEGILTCGARTHYDWQRIWEAAATLKPTRGLLKTGSRFWDPINELFQPDPPAEAIRRSLPLLDQYQDKVAGLNQLLIETIAARLMFLGEFRPAVALRRLTAQNRVRELRHIPLESPLWLKHLLGAYAYLGETEKLTKTAARPFVDTPDAVTRWAVEKLAADAALFSGDPEPLRQHAAERAATTPLTAEDTFAELINGARVAVVGPAPTKEELGAFIDDHDVVIRTRFTPEFTATHAARAGSRTDIAYYAGHDLPGLYDDVGRATETGQLRLAVARPLYRPVVENPPDWLRFARFEFGLYHRGAPLGIQRILYDLLQFRPAEINLMHADFYAGSAAFASGYRQAATGFGPRQAINDLVMMHDLRYEFTITQQLVTAGLVTAHGTAAEVLSLEEETYLTRLENGPLGSS